MTSWMWASGGALTASATTFATVSGLQELRDGVVLAALVGDQALLHLRGDPAGVHRRHPQRRLVVAQRIREPAQRELARRVRRQAG